MKKIVLATVLTVLAVAVHVGAPGASEAETMKGEFLWNNENQTGAVEATFTPKGEGTWDVVFHFIWEDKPHAWAGTAEGSLTAGALKGEVTSDGERKQPFTFEGSIEDGKFTGTHASTRDGERKELGTLTLSR